MDHGQCAGFRVQISLGVGGGRESSIPNHCREGGEGNYLYLRYAPDLVCM